ncbi:fatty acid desaturase-domain-containing protein [Mycena pura]|uniref:Fatty acid desaturase-domain-containing protein n=1 Tax=Mycena pura TaxID=153505 RepID=A0AAD6V243_9AGAR|nr:fatty acid desaturase-domain-containing protein [Mycena pura]
MRSITPFEPPDIILKDVHAAVPRHLLQSSTARSLYYIARHCAVTMLFYWCATCIPSGGSLLSRSALWLAYGAWQGFAFAGIWCLGAQAGHDALSPHPLVNAALGLLLHSFVLTPYYSWRATHRAHHATTNNLDRDETYLPPLRSDFGLPEAAYARPADYMHALGETPAFTLFKLFIRQFFGFQLYLIHNRKGNRRYPPWTSHYNPSSALFRPEQRGSIILSNVAIASMFVVLWVYTQRAGAAALAKFYILPWLFAHNWIVTATYLQHASPWVPYYRTPAWTFARGALATVDRPLYGWVGRFFMHHIASDHVAHHFFSGVPFYNLPEVTAAIRPVLGEHYNYDDTPALVALWQAFTQCTFVEDKGDVVLFRNRAGQAQRTVNGEAN